MYMGPRRFNKLASADIDFICTYLKHEKNNKSMVCQFVQWIEKRNLSCSLCIIFSSEFRLSEFFPSEKRPDTDKMTHI